MTWGEEEEEEEEEATEGKSRLLCLVLSACLHAGLPTSPCQDLTRLYFKKGRKCSIGIQR